MDKEQIKEIRASELQDELSPETKNVERQSWIGMKLKAILRYQPESFGDQVELTELQIDHCCRSALAGSLTPGGLGSPFDR